MRTFVARLLVLAVLSLSFAFATGGHTAAYDPLGNVDCSSANDSAVCNTGAQDPSGSTGVIHKVTQLIADVAGAAAVLVIILAGIRYITSGGDPEQVSRAKKTIIFASVGLVVIILAQAIINIVIGKVQG